MEVLVAGCMEWRDVREKVSWGAGGGAGTGMGMAPSAEVVVAGGGRCGGGNGDGRLRVGFVLGAGRVGGSRGGPGAEAVVWISASNALRFKLCSNSTASRTLSSSTRLITPSVRCSVPTGLTAFSGTFTSPLSPPFPSSSLNRCSEVSSRGRDEEVTSGIHRKWVRGGFLVTCSGFFAFLEN